jgi:hypothetical protein
MRVDEFVGLIDLLYEIDNSQDISAPRYRLPEYDKTCVSHSLFISLSYFHKQRYGIHLELGKTKDFSVRHRLAALDRSTRRCMVRAVPEDLPVSTWAGDVVGLGGLWIPTVLAIYSDLSLYPPGTLGGFRPMDTRRVIDYEGYCQKNLMFLVRSLLRFDGPYRYVFDRAKDRAIQKVVDLGIIIGTKNLRTVRRWEALGLPRPSYLPDLVSGTNNVVSCHDIDSEAIVDTLDILLEHTRIVWEGR